MRIYPAVHYTMGGLWVDYNLMSNIPGLFVLGEANFSDHGANRLGASALMQGLADGYFVIPYTIGNYFASDQASPSRRPTMPSSSKAEADVAAADAASCCRSRARTRGRVPSRTGQGDVGKCGMARTRAEPRSKRSARSASCARNSGRTSTCPAATQDLNQALERAGRVADFLEFGELLASMP